MSRERDEITRALTSASVSLELATRLYLLGGIVESDRAALSYAAKRLARRSYEVSNWIAENPAKERPQ